MFPLWAPDFLMGWALCGLEGQGHVPASEEAATYCLQHCTTPRVSASWRNCF